MFMRLGARIIVLIVLLMLMLRTTLPLSNGSMGWYAIGV